MAHAQTAGDGGRLTRGLVGTGARGGEGAKPCRESAVWPGGTNLPRDRSILGKIAERGEKRAKVSAHIDDPQDRAIRVLGIVYEQIVRAPHRPKSEPAGQKLKPPVPSQWMTGNPFGSVRNGHGEAIRVRGAGDTGSDVVNGLVDIPQRLWGEVPRPHKAAPYFSASRARTRASISSPDTQPSRSASSSAASTEASNSARACS